MPKPLQPCGTNAAYNRHRYHDQEPCEPCKAAHRAYSPGEQLGPRSEPAPCGSAAAARRHYRLGEPLDEACRRADRLEQAELRGHTGNAQSPDSRAVRNGVPWKPYRRGGCRPDWAVAAIYRAEAEHGTPPEDEEAVA